MMEVGGEKGGTIKTNIDQMPIEDYYEAEGNRVFKDYEAILEMVENGDRTQCLFGLDAKGWHCNNQLLNQGHTLCDHRLTMLTSQTTGTNGNNSNNNIRGNNNNIAASCLGLTTPPSIKKPAKGTVWNGTRRGRPRAASTRRGSSSSSSNPYEFYYYSGFGPLWGKRRGNKGESNKNEPKARGTTSTTTCAAHAPFVSHDTASYSGSSSSSSELDHFDQVHDVDDDEDDDHQENGDSGSKRRMRKPVKARSLKSLM